MAGRGELWRITKTWEKGTRGRGPRSPRKWAEVAPTFKPACPLGGFSHTACSNTSWISIKPSG